MDALIKVVVVDAILVTCLVITLVSIAICKVAKASYSVQRALQDTLDFFVLFTFIAMVATGLVTIWCGISFII